MTTARENTQQAIFHKKDFLIDCSLICLKGKWTLNFKDHTSLEINISLPGMEGIDEIKNKEELPMGTVCFSCEELFYKKEECIIHKINNEVCKNVPVSVCIACANKFNLVEAK